MSLTAAEAMVLLEPQPASGIPAAKVTLLALLAEGVLKQEPSAGRCFGKATRLVLARQPAENPPHVAAVLEAVRASKAATVADVASRLSQATNGFATFVPALVRPRLMQRGLLVERRHQEQRRVLFFFRRTVTVRSWHPTEAGAREQSRLRGLLGAAPAIRAMLDEDTNRAAAMAASLGVLILLVPALVPFLGQCAEAMALHNLSGTSDSGEGGGDFSWTSSVDAISADIDASFDSARSDAASDSGSYSSADNSYGGNSFSGSASSYDSGGGSDSSGGGGGE